MRDWVTNVRTTHYILGSVLGPHPFPRMVRDFHRVIGEEAKRQLRKRIGRSCPTSRSPASAAARTRIGLFGAFLADRARAADRRRGGRPRHAGSASTPRASPARARRSACCTARARACCRTRTARSRPRTRSRPGSTIRRSAPSTRCCADLRAGRVRHGDRRARRSPPSTVWPRPRGSCPRSRAPTRSPRRCGARAGCRAATRSWSTSPGAATRTSSRCSPTTADARGARGGGLVSAIAAAFERARAASGAPPSSPT